MTKNVTTEQRTEHRQVTLIRNSVVLTVEDVRELLIANVKVRDNGFERQINPKATIRFLRDEEDEDIISEVELSWNTNVELKEEE